jgi:hypothetical protein
MRGLAMLGLGLALVACQPPTQIRVEIVGSCTEVGVVARNQINDESDVAALTTSDECAAGTLDIVLVPETGSEAVEILIVAAIDDRETASACLDLYVAAIATENDCTTESCQSCIFARRSTQFADGESRTVVVTLDEACAGNTRCDLTETCVGGSCVSAATICDDEGVCDLEEDE